jgi:hypothetical protein
MLGRGRSTSLPVESVMLASSWLELSVANLVEERAMWSSGKMQVLGCLVQCIYMALLLSFAVHNGVRLGKILMAVVNAIGAVVYRVWGVQTPLPPKFRSFEKAEPNSQLRGKYIDDKLIRIRVSVFEN